MSESAVVRIFYEGRLQAEILPELWLLSGTASITVGGSLGHFAGRGDFHREEAAAKAEQSK